MSQQSEDWTLKQVLTLRPLSVNPGKIQNAGQSPSAFSGEKVQSLIESVPPVRVKQLLKTGQNVQLFTHFNQQPIFIHRDILYNHQMHLSTKKISNYEYAWLQVYK